MGSKLIVTELFHSEKFNKFISTQLNTFKLTVGYGKFGFEKFGVFFKNRNSDTKI